VTSSFARDQQPISLPIFKPPACRLPEALPVSPRRSSSLYLDICEIFSP